MPTASHKTSSRLSVRRRIKQWTESPFGCLVSHFLLRMSRGGRDMPPSDEFEMGTGFLLGILAVPGAIYCFLMFNKYSTLLDFLRGKRPEDIYLKTLPDKFPLIALAMAITGIVTVLKWDQILPDAQDYLNLAPLPLHRRRILFANAVAILIAILVVTVDVNGLPTIFFPFFVTASVRASSAATFLFVAQHAGCVLLASLFSIFSVFAILSAFSAVLPRETFRAWSPWIRATLMMALIIVIPAGFGAESLLATLRRNPQSLLRYFPPLWYLGLYQSWQHRASPVLAALAHKGALAVPVAFTVMALTYGLSYKRRFGSVLEDSRAPSKQYFFVAVLPILDWFADPRAGFPRACQRFAVRALLRNEAHRLAIVVSAGIGGLIALADRSPWAPLAAAYILILGIRIAIDLPVGVAANWIFRATVDPRGYETLPIVRRLMLSFVVPLIVLPWFVWDSTVQGVLPAAVSSLYVFAVSILLIDMQLFGYRRVPLTCPMPGFRDNLLMLCLLQVVGFVLFANFATRIEKWMFAAPWRFALVPAALFAERYWNRRRIAEAREAGEWEEGMTFENLRIPEVERLNLSDGM